MAMNVMNGKKRGMADGSKSIAAGTPNAGTGGGRAAGDSGNGPKGKITGAGTAIANSGTDRGYNDKSMIR